LRTLGKEDVPAPSTITAILRRHDRIDPKESAKHTPWHSFEADEPNDLWQMDFKGHFVSAEGRCHPLTVLDDHSRYSLGLEACQDEKGKTVQQRLKNIFRRYGLPKKILVDNGSPWGSDEENQFTWLTVWLIRQGIKVLHSRPFHPQTLGKDERFHRTLKAEILGDCVGHNIYICQQRFDYWRKIYNLERPHESLNMEVPASRYRLSPICYKEEQPPIEYGPDDIVRKVQDGGWFSYRNHEYRMSKAFKGERVALRPTACDSIMDVFFCNLKVAQINLAHNS
jgi:transposase InsO family protein